MNEKKETILIVDDDEDDCIFLRESLETIGLNHHIHYILDAEKALDFLKNTSILPALVILDVNMPRMNGIELLGIIKTQHAIPIILYTTNCTDDVITEGKKLGAIDCIKKGVTQAESLLFVKKIFDLLKSKNE